MSMTSRPNCRLRMFPEGFVHVQAPALIALSDVPSGAKDSVNTLVYPDPLLSADEGRRP